MGVFHADILLINYKDKNLAEEGYLPKENIRQVTASMAVDSAAVMMAINQTIKNQLGLSAGEWQSFSMADGSIVDLEIVYGIEVRFANRSCRTDAIVLQGDTEPLFGAVPMELMDLIISPFERRLTVNPKHPNKPQLSLKGYMRRVS